VHAEIVLSIDVLGHIFPNLSFASFTKSILLFSITDITPLQLYTMVSPGSSIRKNKIICTTNQLTKSYAADIAYCQQLKIQSL